MSKRHVMFTLSLTTYPTTNREPNSPKPSRILETGCASIAFVRTVKRKSGLWGREKSPKNRMFI